MQNYSEMTQNTPAYYARLVTATGNETTVTFSSQPTTSVSAPGFWTPINTTFIFIGIVGILGNSFACGVVVLYPPLRKRLANYFIINQCVIDLASSFFLILNTAVAGSVRGLTGPSLVAYCYLIGSRILFTSVFVASVWNMSALAVERYLKIVHPIQHKLKATRAKILSACVGVWIVGLIYRVAATMTVAQVIDGVCIPNYFPTLALRTINQLFVFSMDFLVPTLVVASCYIQIARVSKRVKALAAPSGTSAGGDRSTTGRRSIIRCLAIVTVAFIVTVGPRQMTVFYSTVTTQPLNINSTYYLICITFNYLNSSVNPFIYIFKYDDFRHAVLSLLGRKSSPSEADRGAGGEHVGVGKGVNGRQPSDSRINGRETVLSTHTE